MLAGAEFPGSEYVHSSEFVSNGGGGVRQAVAVAAYEPALFAMFCHGRVTVTF